MAKDYWGQLTGDVTLYDWARMADSDDTLMSKNYKKKILSVSSLMFIEMLGVCYHLSVMSYV